MNDFENLDVDLGGIEKKYQLRRQFRGPDDPPPFEAAIIDPVTGLRVPHDPFIVMDVSFSHSETHRQGTLHYRLDRSSWKEEVKPGREDRALLERKALEALRRDLEAIDGGAEPEPFTYV
jgi:hypothetical protein